MLFISTSDKRHSARIDTTSHTLPFSEVINDYAKYGPDHDVQLRIFNIHCSKPITLQFLAADKVSGFPILCQEAKKRPVSPR